MNQILTRISDNIVVAIYQDVQRLNCFVQRSIDLEASPEAPRVASHNVVFRSGPGRSCFPFGNLAITDDYIIRDSIDIYFTEYYTNVKEMYTLFDCITWGAIPSAPLEHKMAVGRGRLYKHL